MTAILFGSISTLSDTSELQRTSFNDAFSEHGLDWQWDQDEYRGLLRKAGGAKRVAEYAEERGEQVDAAAVHATKSERFREHLTPGGVGARPGVKETIAAAKDKGYKVGLVTTTSPENVQALVKAMGIDSFDVIVDASTVSSPKPDPAAYEHALKALGARPDDAVAIEDNEDGIASAKAAGIRAVAFPNENTAGHAFSDADGRLEELSFDAVAPAGAGA
jgi:HAD superfamily hydrolase (TIGR01509 family)